MASEAEPGSLDKSAAGSVKSGSVGKISVSNQRVRVVLSQWATLAPTKGKYMATSQMSKVIPHLRRTVLLQDGAGLTDRQLLEDYISHRDEEALAALVRRHGPMVWGVCRRVLPNYHDAKDAFDKRKSSQDPKAHTKELTDNWECSTFSALQNTTPYEDWDCFRTINECGVFVRMAWPHLPKNPPDYDDQMKTALVDVLRSFAPSPK